MDRNRLLHLCIALGMSLYTLGCFKQSRLDATNPLLFPPTTITIGQIAARENLLRAWMEIHKGNAEEASRLLQIAYSSDPHPSILSLQSAHITLPTESIQVISE